MKVDIISSPQVRKVGSIPKTQSVRRETSKMENVAKEQEKPVLKSKAVNTASLDINRVKSTYNSSRTYKSVSNPKPDSMNQQMSETVDTYASYRKRKYAERIKTRFNLLG